MHRVQLRTRVMPLWRRGKGTWTSRMSGLSEHSWAIVCVTPALSLLAVFAAIPILQAVWLSLHARLPMFGIDRFIGLANYQALLQDARVWAAFGTTAYFTAVSVALEVGLGLGMALLAYGGSDFRRGPQTSALRVIMLVPWAVPSVVSARIWEWLYHPDYGVVNYLLSAAGVIEHP